MRGQTGERASFPADQLPQLFQHCPFHGSGPGAHLVNRHDLIGDCSERIEQSGQGNRREPGVRCSAGRASYVRALASGTLR